MRIFGIARLTAAVLLFGAALHPGTATASEPDEVMVDDGFAAKACFVECKIHAGQCEVMGGSTAACGGFLVGCTVGCKLS